MLLKKNKHFFKQILLILTLSINRLTNIFENTVQNTPSKAKNIAKMMNKYLTYFRVDLIINLGERLGIV